MEFDLAVYHPDGTPAEAAVELAEILPVRFSWAHRVVEEPPVRLVEAGRVLAPQSKRGDLVALAAPVLGEIDNQRVIRIAAFRQADNTLVRFAPDDVFLHGLQIWT